MKKIPPSYVAIVLFAPAALLIYFIHPHTRLEAAVCGGLALSFSCLLFAGTLSRNAGPVDDRWDKAVAEMKALSAQDAQERADALLRDPARCRCEPADGAVMPEVAGLPPSVRRLFARYRSVQFLKEGDTLSWDALADRDPYIRIGADGARGSVRVVRDEETVYWCVDEGPDPANEASILDRFPSVDHFIVFMCSDDPAPPPPPALGV